MKSNAKLEATVDLCFNEWLVEFPNIFRVIMSQEHNTFIHDYNHMHASNLIPYYRAFINLVATVENSLDVVSQ